MSDKIIIEIFKLKSKLEKEKYISSDAFNHLFSFMISNELYNEKLEKQLNYALLTGGKYLKIQELIQ